MPKPTPRQATSGPLVQKRASTTPALPVLAEQKGVGAVKVYNWGDNNLLA